MIASYLLPTAQTCENHLLEPKWLLCPNLRVGNQWKDQINLGGINSINLHSYTIKSLVLELASSELVKSNLRFAGAFQCSQIVASVVTKMVEDESLAYFSDVQNLPQLAHLLWKSIQDVRMSGLDSTSLSNDSIEVGPKADDLKAIFHSYVEELSSRGLADYADCLSIATKLVENGNAAIPDNLNVICPIKPNASRLETDFLESLKQKCSFVAPNDQDQESLSFTPAFESAVGEVNEVQVVLQRAFDTLPNTSLDQIEVLHTDYSTYVPLFHEQLMEHVGTTFSDIDSLPITFGEGLACIYSRPGRALRSWLRWIRADFLQASLVKIIREGLIAFDREDEVAIGFAGLAHRFRKLPIGFGRERYELILSDAIASARESVKARDANIDASDHGQLSQKYDFGLLAFEQLNGVCSALIKDSPVPNKPAKELLNAAKKFLNQYARAANKFDNYAKAKLLDDIRAMELAIDESPGLEIGVWVWLESLPVESRILASGPRPGCIHVDHVAKGGHSGRSVTFVLGLDDSRFPLRSGQDPLLLDFERQNISDDLQTAGEKNVRSGEAFRETLSRLNGTVTFTFATQSLAADRGQYPSSALLELFRTITDQSTASMGEFLSHVGIPNSFCSSGDSQTHSKQWWQSKLAAEPDVDSKAEVHEEGFSHFKDGKHAVESRTSEEFTQFDGLVPDAGKELNPSNESASRTSPSRLETFGTCPRKFFFRYGLGIYPPDEHEVDHEKWLDALQLGSLVHDVFEDFLRELTKEERIPELAKDQNDLLELLHKKVAILKQTIPVPNQDAYERQIQRLEKTCEIFLRSEEEHCRSTGSVPWILEASIGLGDEPSSPVDCAEPVSLSLSDGRAIKVGGRIDRIDRIGGSGAIDFSIWDYKSGSAWGFDAGDPFKQGRKLQPYLYAGMLRHRLIESIDAEAKVNYFGYFFPSPRTEGLRLQWTTGELNSGDAILRHICNAISSGAFIATNEKSDCKFCDYLPICGTPFQTAASSLVQLENCDHKALDPIRALRGVSLDDPPF